jgi:hypothetical protein
MSEENKDFQVKIDAYVDLNFGSRFYGWLFLKDSKTDSFKPVGLLPFDLITKAKDARDANCGK